MNILDITAYDIANGPGTRLTIWLAGCDNHCPGCWSPHTWDPGSGTPITQGTLQQLHLLSLDKDIDAISVLGGDPMFWPMHGDAQSLINVLSAVKSKPIWLWTGYKIEFLREYLGEDIFWSIFKYIDTVVDGPFIKDKKNMNLMWRGSSNQRILKIDYENLKIIDTTKDYE